MQFEASHKRKFLSGDCLEQIWSDNDLREYVLGLNIGDWEFIQNNLLKTLSILAWIHWDEWSQLARILLKDRPYPDGPFDRLDRSLPHPNKATLARPDFLAKSYFADLFYEAQYIFLPIMLVENRDLEYPRDLRLPFISESESMGTGSYGNVTKVVVAKGQFRNTQGNVVSWVSAPTSSKYGHESNHRASSGETFGSQTVRVQA
jgi:hypothetical protein